MPWRVTGKAGEQCENFSIQWRSNELVVAWPSPRREMTAVGAWIV